jgi:single-strand DNA-binding protein
MLNQFSIIGNVGNTPELRYTQQGVAVCDFSVAVNKRYKTANGEQREETTWVKVTCWRGLAENVAQYLKKGRQVYVSGEASVSAYMSKDNSEPRASLELTANNVTFIGGRDDAQSGGDSGESLPF